MKKLIYIFVIIFITSCLVGLTLYIRETPVYKNEDISDFLDKNEKNYIIKNNNKNNNNDKYVFDVINKLGQDNYYYKKISPIDGVYFYSESQNPIKTSKTTDGKYLMEISNGTYIFTLNDIFNKYEIKAPGLNISQLGKGIFLVIVKDDIKKIYSFNSMLDIKILSDNSEVTSFTLFPSLFFKYDPAYNNDLKSADILRIAMIDDIIYLDVKNPGFPNNLFESRDLNGKELLKIFNYDIKNKFLKFSALYHDLALSKESDIEGEGFIGKYPFLFLNDTKRDIYLKNSLSKSFLHFFSNTQNNADGRGSLLELQNNVKNTLDEMKASGDDKYQQGVGILKNYFYISYYGSLIKSNEDILLKDSNNLLKIMKNIIPDVSGDEYFSTLSDTYLSYNFSGLDQDSLSNYIDLYFGKIISNKLIGKDDCLPASFFLTQYLSYSMDTSKNSLSNLFHLFDISDYYYNILQDDNKRLSLLSLEFFNYSKILGHFYSNILDTYFKKEDKGLVLKPEYGGEKYLNIPKDTLDNINEVYIEGSKKLIQKKDFYYKNFGNGLGGNDAYEILRNKYLRIKSLISILNDYGSYIIKINLNSENKNLKGIEFVSDNSLSIDKLKSYLGQFNNLDLSTLKVLNNYNKDLFYSITVNILNYSFEFKLNPVSYVVYDLVYTDSSGKINNQFKGLPISFEEKEKYLNDMFSSEEDPIKKQRLDFKNIFSTIYLSQNEQSNSGQQVKSPDNSQDVPIELSLFVKNELLDKDFENIKNSLVIGFQNIKAKIENGEYLIDLVNISKSFTADNDTFNATISSSYIFKTHSFSNIKLLVKKSDGEGNDFNSSLISIIPDSIYLIDIEGSLKDLGYYLKALKVNYKNNSTNLKIDLNLRKVFIDSDSFNVNFNKTGN